MTSTMLTPDQWAVDVLTPLVPGAQLSHDVPELVDWARTEGGAGPQWGIPNNLAANNPLNLAGNPTGNFPGSPTPGNNPPVMAYGSWDEGIAATIERLQEPFASRILSDLQSGAPETQLSADVAASGWGTSNWDPGGAASTSSASATTTSATATTTGGLNLNPFDLFASSLWSSVGPFLAKAMLVVAGLAVVVVGLARLAKPSAERAQASAGPAAVMAAA